MVAFDDKGQGYFIFEDENSYLCKVSFEISSSVFVPNYTIKALKERVLLYVSLINEYANSNSVITVEMFENELNGFTLALAHIGILVKYEFNKNFTWSGINEKRS